MLSRLYKTNEATFATYTVLCLTPHQLFREDVKPQWIFLFKLNELLCLTLLQTSPMNKLTTYKFADSRKLYFEFEQKKCVSNFSFTLSFKMTAELIKGCFVINFRSYESIFYLTTPLRKSIITECVYLIQWNKHLLKICLPLITIRLKCST